MSDPVIIQAVAYEDDADLEFNGVGEVSNHEELVNSGQTYDEIRALANTPQTREHVPESMIIEEGDFGWKDEYADMEPGDAKRL